MKQKYLLEKQEDNSLVIKEYGELEEGIFSLLCEEKFETEDIEKALEKDDRDLIEFLRTHNMFPPFSYAEKIAEAARQLFSGQIDEDHTEILFDELAMAERKREEEEAEFLEAEDELLDDILDGPEDDFDSLDDDLSGIDAANPKSIKVDDDSNLDMDI